MAQEDNKQQQNGQEKQPMLHSNLQPLEILPLALTAYPAYQLLTKYDDKKAFAAVVGGAALMLDVAAGAPTFMGSGEDGKFSFKNIGLMEILTLSAFGYAAYRLIKIHNDMIAAACLSGVVLLGITQAGKSQNEW